MNYIARSNAVPTTVRILLFALLLLFVAPHCFGQTASLQVFHRLVNVPPEKRTQEAISIYKDRFRKVSPQEAMRALDTLRNLAIQLNDKRLEGSVLICRADYYSVNRGFNLLSTTYHQDAIDFAIENKLLVDEGIYLHKKAYYYSVYSKNIEACQYFLEAYEKFKEAGFQSVPDISQILSEQASFFYNLKDWDSALSLLQQALKYPQGSMRLRASINNTIGLINREKQQFNIALYYFKQTLKIAEQARDAAWVGIATGNIGSVYFLQGEYKKAMPLITADYATAMKFADSVNAGKALLRISQVNLQANNLSLVGRQLDTAATLVSNCGFKANLSSVAELYRQRAIWYEKTNNLPKAIDYRTRYEAAKDSLARRDNIAAVENVKLKWEMVNHRAQIKQLQENMKTAKFKRNAVIFILFLLGVIFVLLFNRHRLKAAKDQQLLLAEKRRVDEELDSAARSLKQYTENLRKNTVMLEKFKTELAQVKAQTDIDSSQHLEQLLNARLMTAEAWDEFKRLFVRVHGNFFTNLRSNYPHLTDTDTRLLSLIKLGLSNREMSNMLGVTIEGIKKSKQRLRKKMDLQPEQDIEQVAAGL